MRPCDNGPRSPADLDASSIAQITIMPVVIHTTASHPHQFRGSLKRFPPRVQTGLLAHHEKQHDDGGFLALGQRSHSSQSAATYSVIVVSYGWPNSHRREKIPFGLPYPTARISSLVALRAALLSSAVINPSLVSSSRQYILMLLSAVPCIDRRPR
jgi:hypothetical protein